MSVKHITDQQVRLYMENRKNHTQATAAAKAGISERTARRIETGKNQFNKSKRAWRTRSDPLVDVWDSYVLPQLEKTAGKVTSVGIFDHLCEHYSQVFDPRARRTLERRIRQWRQLHGPSQDVVFDQTHVADFTVVSYSVTIRREPFKHRLFHYRLAASGRGYAQAVCPHSVTHTTR